MSSTMQEDGMATLVRNGLDLGGLDDLDHAELLHWHTAANSNVPDADLTVLLWIKLLDGTHEWAGGCEHRRGGLDAGREVHA